MKPILKYTLIGAGVTAFAIFVSKIFKKNKKEIKKQVKKEKKEFKNIGIEDVKELDEIVESANKEKEQPVEEFAELPIPEQVMSLLIKSNKWTPEDIDWENAVYPPMKEGSYPGVDEIEGSFGYYNSVHVLFKESGNVDKVGFFIEVPPIIQRHNCISLFQYKDYSMFLDRFALNFWESHRVACEKPRDVEVHGLYSKKKYIKDEGKNKVYPIMEYVKIPDSTLLENSVYKTKRDGLFHYYSSVKMTEFDDIRPFDPRYKELPEDVEDIHIFMGVWFPIEDYARRISGISISQIILFLEEMVKDPETWAVTDQTGRARKTLGPVIVHPGNQFEYILTQKLKIAPIVYDD